MGKIFLLKRICKLCYYDGATCVSNCPIGKTPDSNNNCIDCVSAGMRIAPTGECIFFCPPDYIDDGSGQCVKCHIIPMVNQFSNCQASCDLGYTVDLSVENICVKCSIMSMLDQDGICVNTCNAGYTNDGSGFCVTCKNAGLYNHLNNCVTSCPSPLTPDFNNNCQECYQIGQVNQDNICKNTCSPGFNEQGIQRICTSCYNLGLVNQSGVCQASCNAPNQPNLQGLCVTCKQLGKFEKAGVCVDTCGDGYISDVNNVCSSCLANGLFLSGTICVAACPSAQTVNGSNECVPCSANGMYEYNNSCVATCPNNYNPDSNSVCKPCLFFNLYEEGTLCVKTCSNSMMRVLNNVCVSCQIGHGFVQGTLCQDKCDKGYISDFNRICVKCTVEGRFVFNGDCVDSCPKGFSPDGSGVCSPCNLVGLFFNTDGYCIGTCNLEFEPDIQTNTSCVPCQENNRLVESGKCVSNCTGNNFTGNNDGICVTCSAAGFLNHGTNCVEICPTNFYNNNGTCVSIGTNYVENGVIVASCSAGYIADSNRICYPCKLMGYYKHYSLNTCYLTCPVGFYQDEVNRNCVNLALENLYVDVTTVVSNCPPNKIADSNRFCVHCGVIDYLEFDGVCVATCPVGIWADYANNRCYDYKTNGEYLYNNQIYLECPKTTIKDTNNNCQLCATMGLLHETSSGKCVTTCNPFHYYNTTTKECIDYINEGLYLDTTTNTLVQQCPSNTINGGNNICVLCAMVSLWNLNGNCVSACPGNYYSDNLTKTCVDFQSLGMYFYNGGIVATCPLGTGPNNNNFCVSCKTLNLFDNLGICQNLPCPVNFFTDMNSMFCVDYINDGKYIFNGTLVIECPLGTISNALNICEMCIDRGMFELNGVCVLSCPPDLYVSGSNVCIDYISQGKFLYNGDIVNECPLSYYPDTLNVCKTCFDAGVYQYLLACFESCPIGTFKIEVTKTCITCQENEVFHIDTCLSKCPNRYTPNSLNECQLCDLRIYNNTCISECPDYSEYQGNINECFVCNEINKVFLRSNITNSVQISKGSCLDNCPDKMYPLEPPTKECKPTTPCFPSPCINNGTCSFTPLTERRSIRNNITSNDSIALNEFKNETYLCFCEDDFYGANCQTPGLIAIKNNVTGIFENITDNSKLQDSILPNESDLIDDIIDNMTEIEELISDKFTDDIYNFISKFI